MDTTNQYRESDPRRPTRQEVLKLYTEGVRPSVIAEQLGISRTRVHQHLLLLRRAGELPALTPRPPRPAAGVRVVRKQSDEETP
jgi:predicted ArsR family transcriptional regulator